MATAYVVTSGDYSAYAIEAVFLDLDKAKEYASRVSDANEVEEYAVLDQVPRHVDILFCRQELTEGDASPPMEWVTSCWEDKAEGRSVAVGCKLDVLQAGKSWPQIISVHVWGTDHERVRKVYSEKRAQAIAEFPLILEKDRVERARLAELGQPHSSGEQRTVTYP